jgi:hypothetical protein
LIAVNLKRWWTAASWRRRTVLLAAALLLIALTACYVVARQDGDESAVERLPSDAAISEFWPEAVVLGRKADSVHRLHEEQSMILNIRLAEDSSLTITARDYGGPFRAWLVAKAFSPTFNGIYWDYPQRNAPDDIASGVIPAGSTLVGFECPDAGGQALECWRWVLWWKRGSGVWEAQWKTSRLSTSSEAITVLSPLWREN